MKFSLNVIACLSVLAFTTSVHGQAPVIVNDSGFENNDVGIPVVGGVQTFVNGTAISSPGWTVSAGTVTIVDQGALGTLLGNILTGDSSRQYLVLNSFPLSGPIDPHAVGSVSQTLTVEQNTTYRITYDAGVLDLGVATGTLAPYKLSVTNGTTPDTTGGALLNLNVGTFGTQSFDFTTTTGQTQATLTFGQTNDLLLNVGGVAIDNVHVAAVPEPRETAGILLVLALVLLSVRRFMRRTALSAIPVESAPVPPAAA